MARQSAYPMILLMTCFIILSVGSAGCASQAPSASPVTGNALSTIEPSQMVLQPSDLPANYTLVEQGERNVSEMRSWSLDHGWKKGYYADYQKNDTASLPGAVIEQSISVYPSGNITLIIPDTVGVYKNWTAGQNNMSFELLSLPTIGDASNALKITDPSDNSHMYLISFVKKDVYQDFWTNGTETDYVTAQQMAGTAAAKIT